MAEEVEVEVVEQREIPGKDNEAAGHREMVANDKQDHPQVPWIGLKELKKQSLYGAVRAEFIATFLYLYITVLAIISNHAGNSSSCAGDVLLSIACTFGGTIFILIYCTTDISGGHINPAVTFGLFVGRKVSLIRALLYMLAQMAGAICGAALVKALQTSDESGDEANSVDHNYTKRAALVVEIMGTFVVVYTVFSTMDPKRKAKDSNVPALAPLPIAFAVFVVHLATIPITRTGINPARSLATAIFFDTGSIWDDKRIFWVGPLVGAAVAPIYHDYPGLIDDKFAEILSAFFQ